MRTAKQKKSLVAEVRQLRRDVDLLGMQAKINALLLRVSRLEIVEAERQN